ncbi:ABC transporter ATP-binding protein [Ramlibacter albus]|uniref:ABC transporter ATP-binding protein n=1 Tax=Ramlibacter albus TaxID=2079448 RepID=A0A923S4P4_9BURK|nr:ABC transporter ATP-binding protein [Ramlibacter albus]MBC5767138.1 ABC transporter ATP-binding protein [Ramlibacter albus]
MAEIRIRNLHKQFTDFTAVKNSSLVLEDGKFVVLLGPSGCGKTTTLRMIAGLEYPTSGQITLDGDDVTYLRPRERDIAMVFQLFALYPHLGVRGNLEFPLRNEGVPRIEIDKRVEETAAILRIGHLLDSSVNGLSGGDRQRVALGRAIVRQPKAFLMDEPLGTLDAEFRELMCVELRKLHDRLKTTTVFVTHDQNEAMALADHIVVMDKGEILQADDPHGIYNFPATLFVARFIGRPPMNLIGADAPVVPGDTSVRIARRNIAVPRVDATSTQVVLGIRPEHVRLCGSDEGCLGGRVKHVEYFGSHWVVEVETEAGALKALADKSARPEQGLQVGLRFDTRRVVLFDAGTEKLLASETTLAHQPGMRHG